jgi:decaprenylphospho-beta-D-ribofuranose 2-oxidase
MTRLVKLSGWGRYPVTQGQVATPGDAGGVAAALAGGPVIARGLGRSYGDAATGARVIDMRGMDRFLAFDPATGVLQAEAGLSLATIIDTLLPRGWFPAVTPGTRFVTLGGAIAADVHGKNHHRDGSFGSCVDWIDVMGADGTVRRAARDQNPDLFHWTLGGMGLTGVILRAAIRLRPVETGWIRQETIPAPNLDAALEAFEDGMDATYSVAWIDALARGPALGRSLVMLGEHARLGDLPAPARRAPLSTPDPLTLRLPFDLPALALNPLSVRAFNALYWRMGMRKAGQALVPWRPYFYPLDAIGGWNRMYGRRGFVQFQCVLPLAASPAGLRAALSAISDAGSGSFLAVLKRFGPQDSRLSFPTEGYTLALDFPAAPASLALLDRLDAIVADHGGRFYLAKDARMTRETLHRTDPRMTDFAIWRREAGLAGAFASAQSERLGL